MKLSLTFLLLICGLGCGDVDAAKPDVAFGGPGPGPGPGPAVDIVSPTTLPDCEGGDRMCAPKSSTTLLTCNDKGNWIPKDCAEGEACTELGDKDAACE